MAGKRQITTNRTSGDHSILWDGSTLAQDEVLVRYLVENIVSGSNVNGHYDSCVSKIMSKIRTKEWQSNFPYKTYIFSVFYGISIKSVVEIKLSLHAQALELLYFNIASTSDELDFNPEASFDIKLSTVFKEVYKWSMPPETVDVIRILRNDVMHTGTIAGISETYRNPKDPEKLEQFFEKYDFNKNQQRTNIQNRISLAHSFELLMQDALIRTLGLSQDDLSFNLAPAWLNPVFGYDHANRPDWLRQ